MPAKIIGMEKLFADLDRFGANASKILASAGMDVMQTAIEAPVKEMCNVETGRGRASIHTRAEIYPNGALIRTGTDVFYMIYMEYGTGIYATGPGGSHAKKIPWVYFKSGKGFRTTRGIKPHPIFNTAMQLNGSKIPGLLEAAISRRINSASKIENLGGLE